MGDGRKTNVIGYDRLLGCVLTEGLLHRINLLKEMNKTVDAEIGQKARIDPRFNDLEVTYEFQDIRPKNIREMLDNLSKATEGKASMSRKRAVELNPIIDDPKEELVQLEKEIQEEQESMLPKGDYYDYNNFKNS
ncbi:MAG TPA: phage portal protein [Bacteroidales bacterium]|nr:phage portal protein [Bacteroidales bacterium]